MHSLTDASRGHRSPGSETEDSWPVLINRRSQSTGMCICMDSQSPNSHRAVKKPGWHLHAEVSFIGEEPWAQGIQKPLFPRKTLSWSSNAESTPALFSGERHHPYLTKLLATQTPWKEGLEQSPCLRTHVVQRCKRPITVPQQPTFSTLLQATPQPPPLFMCACTYVYVHSSLIYTPIYY